MGRLPVSLPAASGRRRFSKSTFPLETGPPSKAVGTQFFLRLRGSPEVPCLSPRQTSPWHGPDRLGVGRGQTREALQERSHLISCRHPLRLLREDLGDVVQDHTPDEPPPASSGVERFLGGVGTPHVSRNPVMTGCDRQSYAGEVSPTDPVPDVCG